MPQCPLCGAYVSSHDEICSYCGAPNAAYHPPAQDINDDLQQGLTSFQQGDYAQAVKSYQRAIAQGPDNFDAYFYLAASLSALGRKRAAIETMQQARRIRPGSAAVDYNLGALYHDEGGIRDARAFLESALQKAETDPAIQDRSQLKRLIRQKLDQLPPF